MEKIHPETGKILHRDIRPFEFNFRGEKVIIEMPGWYPDDNDEGIFTQEDMKVAGNALRTLKAEYKKRLEAGNFTFGNVSFV